MAVRGSKLGVVISGHLRQGIVIVGLLEETVEEERAHLPEIVVMAVV